MTKGYVLEIEVGDYQVTMYRFAFRSKEAALSVMDALEPLIGLEKFHNRDPDKSRFRIESDCGAAVVAVEHVKVARVIDHDAWHELTDSVRKHDAAMNAETIRLIVESVVALQAGRKGEAGG